MNQYLNIQISFNINEVPKSPMRLPKLLALLFFPALIFGQKNIAGRVSDSDGQPIAFASVLVNSSPTDGVLTDIDGHFSVARAFEIRSLTVRCIGFETRVLDEKTLKNGQKRLEITLFPSENTTAEAVVVAGENPAHRLIRLAVENRDANNPEKRAAFRCETYNKITFDLLPDPTGYEAFMSRKNPEKKAVKKSRRNFRALEKNAADRHAFIMETVTERLFRRPDQNQETVRLNRVAGLESSELVALANQIQPFSFYGDWLPFLGTNYLNPISAGSTAKYHFVIEDTLFVEKDTVWAIRFWPRKGKAFEGLAGVVHLHSFQYAIQNVRAEPAELRPITMRIEQQYSLFKAENSFFENEKSAFKNDRTWFPEQLNFDIVAPKYPNPFVGSMVNGRSYISKIDLDPSFSKRAFDPAQPLQIRPDAYSKNDSAWSRARFRQLLPKEISTYHFLDSIGKKKRFDRKARLLQYAASGLAPIPKSGGWLHFDLSKILKINDFEGARLGLGLTTESPFSLRPRKIPIDFRAFAGLGLTDKTWKMGGETSIRLRRASDSRLFLKAERELLEPGALNEFPSDALVSRALTAVRMDLTDAFSGGFSSRFGPALTGQIRFSASESRPRYDYFFAENAGDSASVFRFAEVSAYLKFSLFSQKTQLFGAVLSETSRLPIVELAFSKNVKGAFGSPFSFEKWVAAVSQTVSVRRLGPLKYRLEAGAVRGSAPIQKLFSANQNPGGGLGFFRSAGVFSTVDTLFLSDRFANVFFQQTIGAPFWRKKWSKPVISVVQNASAGFLRAPEKHQKIGFLTPRRGFFESGLVLDHLLKLNYLNLSRLGLGLGFFYGWGEFASPRWRENLAVRGSFRWEF